MRTPKKSVPSVQSVSKPSSPSAPSAKSAVKKSSAAKSAKAAEIREDLESVLLQNLTPDEWAHVAHGVNQTFDLRLTKGPSRKCLAYILSEDGKTVLSSLNLDHTCDELWEECERLRPQDADELANTTVQITHAGRIALAADRIINQLFCDGTRLVIEQGGKVGIQGWGRKPAWSHVETILKKTIPDPSPNSIPSLPSFPSVQDPNSTAARIVAKCAELAQFLLGKNKSYGDSALKPIRVLSRATAREGLCTRADDKLARLQNSPGAYGDNDVWDLTGYLIFLLIQDDLDAEAKKGGSPQ